MAHIALYRSWRPQTFQDMVGQKHIVQTLQNSLKEGRITHAYLFSGPRGTGKTSAAKILAKAVNCVHGPAAEPCNECPACVRITEGSVMDVVEIDAASNRGVEEIRDIRDKVKYAPTEVRRKVYIIDEVHMLTTEAFNALLKTLEEPPGHVMFVLATTEPHRLPATIVSRCQRFDFRRVPLEEQVARLQFICGREQITAEPDALQYIARLSDGGMRDALSLLDQIISFTGAHITYEDVLSITGGMASEQFAELAAAVQNRDVGAVLELIDSMMQEGKSAERCIENVMHYFRDVLMLKMVPDSRAITERIVDRDGMLRIAGQFSNERIFQIIDILNHYQVEMKYASQPQTLFEVAMMKICSIGAGEPEPKPADNGVSEELTRLSRKLERLEQQLAELAKAGASPGSAANEPSPPAADRRPANKPLDLRKGAVKLEPFLAEKEKPAFKQVLSRWSQVLSQVKERKITVHAWLVDGEPVSATEDAVLVAFKNTIHRETTEKPANKQLIEQVLAEIFGKPLKLATVMQKEWKEAAADAPEEQKSFLQLEPEDVQTGKHKEEWINEAIQLFGEDLVVIKEDD